MAALGKILFRIPIFMQTKDRFPVFRHNRECPMAEQVSPIGITGATNHCNRRMDICRSVRIRPTEAAALLGPGKRDVAFHETDEREVRWLTTGKNGLLQVGSEEGKPGDFPAPQRSWCGGKNRGT